MKQYNVTGMSCAACSARVEKAVSKVPGVSSCSVSLLTNSMGVEGTASEQEIVAAVEAAGYGASPKQKANASADAKGKSAGMYQEAEEALKDHETPKLRKRLIASVVFLLVLMYFSMGHMMWNWPIPSVMADNHVAFAAIVNGYYYGDQPEVFHQRFQKSAARFAEYGYACSIGRRRIVWI